MSERVDPNDQTKAEPAAQAVHTFSLDAMVADARCRLRAAINRSAGQHKRAMADGWKRQAEEAQAG